MVADLSFEEFVTEALPALSRYARALARDTHAAEDLVQDTLVRVAGAWRRVRANANPLGYATTTMFRTYVSRWRIRRRNPDPLVLIDEPAAATDRYAQVDTRVTLHAALDTLPRLQRAVLVATYLDDAPDETIAALVGRTTSTVRSLRRRGLAALRTSLGPDPALADPALADPALANAAVADPARDAGPAVDTPLAVDTHQTAPSTHEAAAERIAHGPR